MSDLGKLRRVAWMTIVLLASMSIAACNFGNSQLDEANQLNQSASEDIKAIDKVVEDNKSKEREIARSMGFDDLPKARTLLEDSLKAIDTGLERAKSAEQKFDKASKLDIDSTIKEYLALRARSVTKAIEAFNELRRGVVNLRDSLGGDRVAQDKAKKEIQQTSIKFEQLINEAKKLEGQAGDIARSNPDKIKPGM